MLIIYKIWGLGSAVVVPSVVLVKFYAVGQRSNIERLELE